MKLPKSLKAFGYNWKVKINKDDGNGEFNFDKKEITIGKKENRDGAIVFHELLELTLVMNFLRFYGQEGSMEFQFFMNHTQMSKVAEDLWQIFQENNLLK